MNFINMPFYYLFNIKLITKGKISWPGIGVHKIMESVEVLICISFEDGIITQN